MGSALLIDVMNQGLLILAELPMWEAIPTLLAETSALSRLLGNVWLWSQVALGLGFVIFVHELGHFLAAKTFGVRCDKFYVGFDVPMSIGPIKLPSTLGKFQWGETEYGIGIIPLGGYVKMLGQDDDPRKAEVESQKIRKGDGEEAPLDPRSYPAKPVWQRMIIISAGVVMNLIFAVILAAVAYWFGVPFTPTVAGSTYGGGPAWAAGIEPGDQVLQAGAMEKEDVNLRYDDFAVSVVMQGFDAKTAQLPVTIQRGSEKLTLTAAPTAKYSPDGDLYRIGLIPPTTPKVAEKPFNPFSYLAEQKPDLRADDLIVAVNGETLPVDPRFDAVLGSELTKRLQANWQDPVTVTVERPVPSAEDGTTEQVQLELPPVPVKSLGMGFAMGPVSAIRSNSIADKAGLKSGDIIKAINGQPITNALEVPSRIAQLAGQEIQLTVERSATAAVLAKAAETETLTAETAAAEVATGESAKTPAPTAADSAPMETLQLTMPGPERAAFDTISDFAGELTLGGLGAAFGVRPEIISVTSEADVRVGDRLLQIQWIASEERKRELSEIFRARAYQTQVIDAKFTVASLYDMLQSVPVGASIKCWFSRDGKTVEAVMPVKYAEGWFWHQRGVGLSPLMHMHSTDSIASALSLGVWETSRRFGDVLSFLRLLVTGKIGSKGVGGPVAIAQAASSEASFGLSRLMLFLTLLSANLAILNFLPIPALDGGHMLFLTAEAIRGKPVSEALQIRLTMAGVLSLLGLMAFVIVKDIMRLMS